MRIIKLSNTDEDMPTKEAADVYFTEELRTRDPEGQFRFNKGKIKVGEPAPGEPLVFSYESKIIFLARAKTSTEKYGSRRCFCIDMNSLIKGKGRPLSELQDDLAKIHPPERNIAKSQGWNRIRISDSDADKLLQTYAADIGEPADSANHQDGYSHHSDTDSVNQDDAEIENDPSIPDTEKQALRNARRGQGKFRDDLLQQYGGKCPVTGICVPEALIASHIQPWRDCNNTERLDPTNGILLAAHIDRLFDQGYITVDTTGAIGKIRLSGKISDEEYEKFGIKRGMKIDISYERLCAMQKYLVHHHDKIFKDRKK